MKRFLPFSFAAGALVFCLQFASNLDARADWSSDFSKAPYVLNKTAVGKEGWLDSTVDGDKDIDAIIVLSPDSGGNVLRLTSSATGELTRRRTFLSNQFDKVEGEKVQLTMSLAYGWAPPPATATSRFMVFTLNADETKSPFSIYYGMSGGIFLNGTYNGIEAANLQILAADQVKAGSFYNFDVLMDFAQKKFDITVTGLDVNDTPFTWTLGDVPFREGHQASMSGINTVRLLNYQGERLTMYVRDISVASIPEPGAIAYLLSAAATGGILLAKRRRQ